jgi:hypothetical protein
VPGPGLDLEPTLIGRISWPHATTLTLTAALTTIRELRIDLTGRVHDVSQQQQSQVVQVWFLPNIIQGTAGPLVSSVQVIHGTNKVEPDGITWATSDTQALLRSMFGPGGQVLLRVHCGHVFDDKERPISAALDAIAPLRNRAPVYGGVFESWFFIRQG